MCSKSYHQKILLRTGVLALSASLLLGCNPSSNSDTALDSQKQLTIKRDNFGVPHIYANDTYGLFYGYGYAIATDRLFQMEMCKSQIEMSGFSKVEMSAFKILNSRFFSAGLANMYLRC